MKFQYLNQKAIEIARAFHKSESDLIDVLQEIDNHKAYIEFGYSSLFDYAVKALKLSEANASNFITVARKSKTVPELKIAVRDGKLTVSKARKITPVLTQDNSEFWITMAEQLPKHRLEKEIVKVKPELEVPERAKYISEKRVSITLSVSEKVFELLKRVQDLESQRLKKPAKYEDSFETAICDYLEKRDPLEKAKRASDRLKKQTSDELRKQASEQKKSAEVSQAESKLEIPLRNRNAFQNSSDAIASVPGHIENRARIIKRIAIPSHLVHQVNLRDRHQCTHATDQRVRCENRRWLEIHHIRPVSMGGQNTLENLVTLCSVHHRTLHRH